MAYRVKLNNLEISCDSYADLRQLLKDYADTKNPARDNGQVSILRQEQSIKKLVASLQSNQKKIFMALTSGAIKNDKELRDQIGVDTNNALAGTLAGLVKNFKRFGLDPSTAILKSKKGSGDSLMYEYQLSADFLEAYKREGVIK